MISVVLRRGANEAHGYIDVETLLRAGEHCEATAIVEYGGRAWLRRGTTADVLIKRRKVREGAITVLFMNDTPSPTR